ncbi:hypothetical protein C7R92_14245 [Brevibacillus porteri]|uniref:Uncharacterized protein n=1 Tax=Brevibacillus porteri TaxID=2126350 RepID=A0ABX5FPP3_9BACL|nr:hypothetical protein C7R92_14245 [Brevibacillus porteri]
MTLICSGRNQSQTNRIERILRNISDHYFTQIECKKSSFQHRERGENLKKEERSVGNLHEHRTSKVNVSFEVESAFRTTP